MLERKTPDEMLALAKNMIHMIAQENGVTEEEVRRDITEAIKAGMANPDLEIQARWKSIPWESGEPTAEEFILWNVQQLQG